MAQEGDWLDKARLFERSSHLNTAWVPKSSIPLRRPACPCHESPARHITRRDIIKSSLTLFAAGDILSTITCGGFFAPTLLALGRACIGRVSQFAGESLALWIGERLLDQVIPGTHGWDSSRLARKLEVLLNLLVLVCPNCGKNLLLKYWRDFRFQAASRIVW